MNLLVPAYFVHDMSTMQWKALSHRQRGGLLGAVGAGVFFVGSCVFTFKLFVIDGWQGITQTAGSDMGNLLGWVAIYGFLSLVIASALSMVALPLLFVIGSSVGWIYDKVKPIEASKKS